MRPLILMGCALLWAFPAMATPQNRRTPVVEAVEKALPSVVNIGTERLVKVTHEDRRQRLRGDLFEQILQQRIFPPTYEVRKSLGSGVVVDREGYILTNYHVIERGSVIKVVLADKTEYIASVLAADEAEDLALLKIDTPRLLQEIELADDDDVLLGETVISVGNPYELAHTVSVGVLSSTERDATYKEEVLYRGVLQTDAAVNPGNSGGPLLNINGQMMGINVSVHPEGQNISFAIPVKRARKFLGRWMSPRLIRKLWVGTQVQEENGEVLIKKVEPDSPAAWGGVPEGVNVFSLNGTPVHSLYEYHKALLSTVEGDRVTFTVGPDKGDTVDVEVMVQALPAPNAEKLAWDRLGIKFADDKEMEKSRLVFTRGILVREIRPESVAASLGLKSGLSIGQINDVQISSLADVGIALEHVQTGDVVSMVVLSLMETDTFIMAQQRVARLRAE